VRDENILTSNRKLNGSVRNYVYGAGLILGEIANVFGVSARETDLAA
jgi:hypothetical protein